MSAWLRNCKLVAPIAVDPAPAHSNSLLRSALNRTQSVLTTGGAHAPLASRFPGAPGAIAPRKTRVARGPGTGAQHSRQT
eukprot:2818375-Prymnesium_polylepis.1